MDTKQLKEKRGELALQMRKLADKVHDEKRDFTKDEDATWEKLVHDFDEFGDQLEREEKLAERTAKLAEVETSMSAVDPRDRMIGREDYDPRDQLSHNGRQPRNGNGASRAQQESLALQAWCLHQTGRDIEESQREAARFCGVNLNAREIEFGLLPAHEYEDFRARRLSRAMGTVPLDKGGVLVAGELVTALEEALLAHGGVRQVAQILRTSKGGSLTYPTVNDTSNEGAQLAEGAAVTEQDIEPGAIVLQDYKFSSKMVKVSTELLTDSAISLPPLLGRMLGTRISRITNRRFTTGTGALQPKGLVTASVLGVTAASATAIATDELYDMMDAIDPAYLEQSGTGWMMHATIRTALRKLKDTTNQYLWVPGLTDGVPLRLLGYPVTINQHMASSVAASNKTLLFGALNKYIVRDVGPIRLRRLVERYADNDQEAFIAFSRHDGNLLDAGTNPVKHLIQAAS